MSDARPVSLGPCARCGEPMWMAAETLATYKRNSQSFYCPHGHKQHYPQGPSEAEKLTKDLERERLDRQRAEQRCAMWQDDARAASERAEAERRRANGYKGYAAKITKRAKAGVCPCCNRHFVQLERHMATKHPTFTLLEIEAGANGKTLQ